MKKLIKWLPEELILLREFDAKIDAEEDKSTRQMWYIANRQRIREQQRQYRQRRKETAHEREQAGA